MAAKILLVEDNPDDAELALHAIRRNALAGSVTVLGDGAEAIDYFECRGNYADSVLEMPDLILLDLKLPKVGGLEVLKHLRSKRETKCIPVVILSTSDDGGDIMSGYNLGVNSYVRKPVDFDEFLDVIKQIGVYWLSLNTPPPK